MSAFETRRLVAPGTLHRGSRWRSALPVLVLAVDAILILAAFVAAYWVRYSLQIGPRIQDHIPLSTYMPLVPVVLLILVTTLVLKGAYSTRLGRESFDEIVTIISSATISVAVVFVVTSMLHQYNYSRGLILYLWVLTILLLSLGRIVVRAFSSLFYRRGLGVRHLLVVGASDVGKMIMQSVMSRPDLGYQLAGFVDGRGDGRRDFGRFRTLGGLADVPKIVESGAIDEIIVALPASAHEDIAPILGLCEHHGVGLKLVPDLFELSLGRVRIDDIAGIPLLDVSDRPWRRVERAIKRLLDIIFAALILMLALPLMAVIAILIRLESGGPILLRQVRVGAGGKSFTCFKFRTMRPDAFALRPVLDRYNESDGPLFKMRNDPRCTPLGRKLRRLSLDELPQLLNVLRGDMSIVGPRPALPEEVASYDERSQRRLEVKPGMTGVWQVSGRSDLGFDEMVMMDTYYIDNWSLALDIKICLRTIAAVLSREGAY